MKRFVVISFFLFLTFSYVYLIIAAIENDRKNNEKIYTEGAEAAKLNINPEANPYYNTAREIWFKGYLEAKKNAN